MIQPLRTVHRRASSTLALVLPMVLLIGLMARRPLTEASPRIRYSGVSDPIGQSDHVWKQHKIRSSFLRNPSDLTEVQVVLDPVDEFSAPDLLVYWSPQVSDGDRLPTQAVLVGEFEGGRPILPPRNNGQGVLILYSVAQQSIVDSAPVGSLR